MNEPQPRNEWSMAGLAVLVGVIAGAGAVVFRGMIALFHNLFFEGRLSVFYDANFHTPLPESWSWLVIFVPVVGAIGVAFLVKTFAPEAKGHGVPEVMDATYYNQGRIRPVVAVVKSIASALSIGSGGSVGREGPIIQIGAAFGSTIGQLVSMPARQRVVLLAAGAGGGIAATFNTPIGGIAFAIELMLPAVNAVTLLPVVVSTITATLIGRLCFGDVPPFLIPGLELPTGQVVHLAGLPLFVILGLALGALAALFVRSIYWFEDGFDRIPGNYYTRHMLGMLLVGVMMFAFMTRSESLFSEPNHFYIEGVGYATIVDVLAGDLAAPVFLLLLAAAKLLATSLTLGSGASGGVFSPCLFIGATAGGAFGALVGMMFPALGISPAAFAVVGMASMVAGSTGALVTGIVMLFEMTRDYHVILPLALTAVIATAVRKRLSPSSVYTLKLLRRGHVVPEGLEAAIDAARTAGHLATSDFGIWRIDPEQEAQFTPQAVPGAAVTIVARGREILGILSPDVARSGAANESHSPSISSDFIIVDRDEGMLDLLARLDESRAHYAVVVAHASEPWADGIIGVVRDRDVVRVAREAALLTR